MMIQIPNSPLKRSLIGSILLVTLLFTSCSTVEILDGLCYNDRDGTHLCPKKQTKPKLPETYKQGVLQCNKYGLIEYCEGRTQTKLNCTCVNR